MPGRAEEEAAEARSHAEKARKSFNDRFWYPEGGYLFDVVDGEAGDDSACRPNQIFAISLPHPILAREHWNPVLAVVREKLLTPVGLRTLSRDHPDYKPNYHGDLQTRDAAYHQGTIWPWLIGPYYDAWLKAHPGAEDEVREGLKGLVAHLDDACIGSISEVFDAEPPFTARGCVAQAWSVAEIHRLRSSPKPPRQPSSSTPPPTLPKIGGREKSPLRSHCPLSTSLLVTCD